MADGAENYYRAAIQVDPTYARALNNLGFLLQTERKNLEEAEQCYRAAVAGDASLVPDHA